MYLFVFVFVFVCICFVFLFCNSRRLEYSLLLEGVCFVFSAAAPPKIPSECETNQLTMHRLQQTNPLSTFKTYFQPLYLPPVYITCSTRRKDSSKRRCLQIFPTQPIPSNPSIPLIALEQISPYT